MTATNDRRHRIQAYTVCQVQDAINNAVFGDDNRRIMSDLFLHNLTYDAVSVQQHISLRGLHNRVKALSEPLETYLKRMN